MSDFLKSMGDFFKLFRTNAANLKAKISEMNSALDQAKRRREDLLTKALPAADVAEMFCALIDQMAAHFPERFLRRMNHVIGDPKLDRLNENHTRGMLFPAEGANVGGLPELETMLAYAFNAQIKEAIRKVLLDQTNHDCGPTRASRRAELPKIEHEIADIEKHKQAVETELNNLRRELQ